MKLRTLSLLSLIGLVTFACSAREPSDHFDGQRFFNPWQQQSTGFWDLVKWKMTSEPSVWPTDIPDSNPLEVPEAYRNGDISIQFVNHATFIIDLGEYRIVTDPIWSERASPFTWLGPKRARKPGVPLEAVDRADMIIISHNHYDHMDLATLEDMNRRLHPKVLVPSGDKGWLEREGITNVSELDWWESITINPELSLHFVPAQHWSRRGLFDRDKSLWGAYVIRYKGSNIYFGGDTGYGPHFKMAKERLGAMNIAILPIGAYEPRWFMRYQHMNPEEAVEAYKDLEAKHGIGMHFGTFQLTDEAIDAPAQALEAARGEAVDFIVPVFGARYRYPL